MSDFLMPSLGADMEAGTLVEWLVKPGQQVKRGDIVAVVETEKGAIEIEIFEAGEISELLAPVGARVPVGTLLARLGGPSGPAPAPIPAAATTARSAPLTTPMAAPAAPRPAAPKIPAAPADQIRLHVTPAARRRAAELGVALTGLKGSGVEGAVALADVEAATAIPSAEPRSATPAARRRGFDPAAMRKAIGVAMARSKREIPHYYLSTTVNLGHAFAWLEAVNRERIPGARLLPAVLFLKATARAIANSPELNGFWVDGGHRPGEGVHIGWAIALRGGGLVAPAIPDAGERTLDDLMSALRELVQRARNGGLRSSELSLPTVTVTSLGERGAESVLPVIYPPQVASVGFGRVSMRPWVVAEAIAARPLVSITLAGDHRASDGHRGGLLLAEIDRLLQEPESL